ncbi:MAG: hypothetical protein ACLQU4_12030 [Limisphaerales bacterium]
MNSALFARPNSLFTYQDPNNVTDFTGTEGYLVAASAGALTVSASATVPAVAVVLDGLPPGRPTSLGALGKTPPIRLRAGGTISQFSRLVQSATGQVVADPGPGTARVIVGLALEAAVAGDFFLADPCFPTIAS